MFKKKFKLGIIVFMLCLLFASFKITSKADSSNKVILGGNTIGLKIETGVTVAGKYQVQTGTKKVSPWKNSDILEGDKIIAYNDLPIEKNTDLLEYLKKDKSSSVTLTIIRNNVKHKTSVDIVRTANNEKSLGIYIKDKIMGIGTLTFIDPNTSHFASLGHGIYEDNVSFGNIDGIISSSKIEGIKKSYPGEAGEKRAVLTNKSYGIMTINKTTGIYGKLTNKNLANRNLVEVAKQEEVEIGPAKFYTVIEGEKIEAFDIKITSVNMQSSSNVKGIKYEVVDARLLEKTGGIVQGMSGSPIVQNGKLIGAVSHVTVDNPKVGYGVHIAWMIDDCNSF